MMVSDACGFSASSGNGMLVAYLRREDSGDALIVYDRRTASGRMVWSSADEGELGGNATVASIALSTDGRILAFVSAVPELIAGDAGITINATADLHLYDTASRKRIRFGASGELDTLLASVPLIREVSLSADGSRIAFVAERALGFPGQADVFVYDRDSCDLSQVNPAEISPCAAVRISGDGRTIFFAAGEGGRLHACDLAAGSTERLEVELGAAEPGALAAAYSVSDDGRFVAVTALGTACVVDRATGAVERVNDPERRRRTAGARLEPVAAERVAAPEPGRALLQEDRVAVLA